MGFFRTLFGIASTSAEVVDKGLSSVNSMLEESSRYLQKQSQIMECLRNLKVLIGRERVYLDLMILYLEIYHNQLDLLKKFRLLNGINTASYAKKYLTVTTSLNSMILSNFG